MRKFSVEHVSMRAVSRDVVNLSMAGTRKSRGSNGSTDYPWRTIDPLNPKRNCHDSLPRSPPPPPPPFLPLTHRPQREKFCGLINYPRPFAPLAPFERTPLSFWTEPKTRSTVRSYARDPLYVYFLYVCIRVTFNDKSIQRTKRFLFGLTIKTGNICLD